MDLSGVIFVLLAVVWAAYLIPKALKHHDEQAKYRSVEEATDQARVVSAPQRPRSTPALAGATPLGDPVGGSGSQAATSREATRVTTREAARRRRRILGVLLLAAVTTGVGAGLGVVSTWVPALAVLITVAFLVLCRVFVRRDQARIANADRDRANADRDRADAGSRSAEPEPAPVELRVHEPTPSPAAEPVEQPEQVVIGHGSGATALGSLEDTAAFRRLIEDRELSTRSPAGAAPGALWDPVPVTLPTYVSKPRATRSVRTIALGEPGVASSGRDPVDSALVAESTAVPQQPTDGRRALGG